jgi:hypothetical protein
MSRRGYSCPGSDEDSESEVTRRLDELAVEIDTSVDPVVKELQRRALTRSGG